MTGAAEPPTRAQIERAASRVGPHVRETPVIGLRGRELGIEGDFRLTLKLESLQHTGSFKPRGAFNRVLSAEVPPAGVIAASGGNHGLAVAWVARALGHVAEIFVPETAPAIKVERLRALGARVFQVGEVYEHARDASETRAAASGALVVHAYDHPQVVAGAGTLARELQQQVPDVDAILVAVGGGGLIGGTAAWARDDTRVVSVEPERCPTLHAALAAGRPVPVEVGGLAVDSLAGPQVGEIPFACARRWVDDALLLPDAAIRQAQTTLWQTLRLVAEPGGATALAALLVGAYTPAPGEHVVALVCGANTDPSAVAS